MGLDEGTRQRISDLIEGSEVVLFMKGTRQAPQCGFSATVVGILDSYLPEYATLDVLANPDIREGIKLYSSWPTIPQLYVRGEFIGGCDIVQELEASGELFQTLGVEPPPASQPRIEISDKAAAGLRQAEAQHCRDGRQLRLKVTGRFENQLTVGPKGPLDVVVESNGISLLLDRMSAQRADGIRIDIVDTPRGPGFKVDNPNAPQLGRMSVHELKRVLDARESLELIDVRTPREHETARIASGRLLDEAERARLEALPKDTRLVFLCHHGGRSAAAAEHFLALGFTNVHNVEGGIDAWSLEIDPSVPRY